MSKANSIPLRSMSFLISSVFLSANSRSKIKINDIVTAGFLRELKVIILEWTWDRTY